MLQTFVSSGTLTVGVGVLCALLITSLTIILLTICMLCYIYRVWTKRRALNARANITELTPVYDDVDVSRSATITVNQSGVDQSGVNQSGVDQSGVNHSLMLRDGGACTRGPPPPKPQPYSGKPVSVLQQTRDNPFSNILGKTTEPAPVYDYVDVSRSATITVNQSGVNQSGVNQSGVDQSGVNQSGVNQSGVNQSGVDQSGVNQSGVNQSGVDQSGVNQSGVNQNGVNQSGVNQSGVDQSGVNHSLMLRDGGACTRGPPPPKPQPYSGKPVSVLQQTCDNPFSNILGKTTEPAPVYDYVDVSRSATITVNQSGVNQSGVNQSGVDQSGVNQSGVNQSGVNQSGVDQSGVNQSGVNQSGVDQSGVNQSGVNQNGVNQSGVNQSGVDQSGVNHSLMLRDGGACTRGPPPPKPQPYSGKPVSVLQQTRDNPFSNILGKTTEPAPVYDYVDVSRSATITVNQSGVNQSGVNQSGVDQSGVNQSGVNQSGVNQSGVDQSGVNQSGVNQSGVDQSGVNQSGVNQNGVNQSGVNQSGVDQSGVNHSLMLRDGGACTRGPPPPKPQPYSGKPVSVLQQTCDNPFSNILGKTTEPAPVYDYVDVSRSATITVNQSGVNQSGVNQSGVNQSGVDQSGVNQSGVNQSGVDQSGVNQSGVDQSGVNHSLMLRDGGACTRGPPPPKPQPYSGKPVSALQQTHDDPFSNLLGEITEPAPVYEQVDDLHPGEFIMKHNAAYGQCSHSPRHTTTTTM